jgi:hypothetical protein
MRDSWRETLGFDRPRFASVAFSACAGRADNKFTALVRTIKRSAPARSVAGCLDGLKAWLYSTEPIAIGGKR